MPSLASCGSLTAVTVEAGPVLPSHEDPVVRATSTLIGGPVGAHARLGGRRWWTVWRVLVALTVITCTLGWAQKAQCRDTRNWSHAGGTYQYTRLCYSDVVALYGDERLSEHATPYVDHPVEYPVLIGAVMAIGADVAHARPTSRLVGTPDGQQYDENQQAATFYDVTVLLMALATLVLVICTGLTSGRRRVWDAALVALAPTIVIHLGTNWDMLSVALASAGLLAWGRRRPWLAGALLGLAVASKAYPLLFLFPIGLLCLRTGRLRDFGRVAAGTLGSAAAVCAAVWPFSPAFATDKVDGTFAQLGPSAWQVLRHGGGVGDVLAALAPHHDGGTNGLVRFVTLNRTRPADFDSLWYALGDQLGHPISGHRLTLGVVGAFLVVAGGVAALALLAPRRPRLPQLLFLTVVGFLLVNKVFSPQYTLWLLPLAVLARPRWRAFLAWQATELVLLVARYAYFINMSPDRVSKSGAPYGWFEATIVVRDGALLALCALVVVDVLRPGGDVVRAGGGDDPAGGVLDGAPDTPAFAARPAERPEIYDGHEIHDGLQPA